MDDALRIFDSRTARWFAHAVGTPTPVQRAAWPAIAAGGHTLVSAPTGTGKTLSAFLVFIDALMAEARAGTLKQELQLIYISPLKSLAGDIRENLRRPLEGILQEAGEDGATGPTVAIRTGDTPQGERQRMAKTPPHILITTPESLFLMLSSKSGQSVLRTARWIILDELHAMIDTKRGAHLMLSVARLDTLCPKPLQRIGLSATIDPLERAAEYLSPDPVTIAAPPMHKEMRLEVVSPLVGDHPLQKDPAWQQLAAAVFAHCQGARSVIAFAEGRAYAEKLAFYVNQLGGEGFARTHHGSLSKEQRLEVENALRRGELRLLCATSSMELGIDVGEIDLVFQIGAPRTISGTMQRLGRAGHNPNRTSVMYLFPRAPAEGLYCGLAAEVARNGGVEHCQPPRLCLDVLAQHLVSMAAFGGYTVDGVMELLPRAYPFREVTREDVRAVLRMLAGDYEHDREIPVRPRVVYDRIHDRVEPDGYSRMLAVSAGGTIPDRGLYAVRTQTGVRLGELDEEFVFEARVGDKFLLGSFAWQIAEIGHDTVVVAPTSTAGARPPFWKGEIKGRSLETGRAYGAILRRLTEAQQAGMLSAELRRLGLDDGAAAGAREWLLRQLAATGVLPDDRTVIVEHFRDETGLPQVMVHSVFGRPVNEPLAILVAEEARRQMGGNVSYVVDDDGFLLFPYGNEHALPAGLLQRVPVELAGAVLQAVLPVTSLFNMVFRYNAARALMMGLRHAGRQPLWVQRMRGAEMMDALLPQGDHPLIRESRRECLEDYWDLPGVEYLLGGIRSDLIRVVELHPEGPSPMALPLRQQTEAAMMYDYAPTPSGVHAVVEQALQQTRLISPAPEQLARVPDPARRPEDRNELHRSLMIEGDRTTAELAEIPTEWLEALEQAGRVKHLPQGLWIAAEQEREYEAALSGEDKEAQLHIVRRLLRYRGAQPAGGVAARYGWGEPKALAVLSALCGVGGAVEWQGLYYHARVFERARRETVKARRAEIHTLPPERYAAVLTARALQAAPAKEGLEAALRSLCGQTFPAAWWEETLLPARVGGYRPELLDGFLAQGGFFWRVQPSGELSFHRYEDIDWEADLTPAGEGLQGDEKIIFDALLKRGASFTQRLTDLLGGGSAHDALLGLMARGLVCADHFEPVRQWLNREKLAAAPLKRQVRARVLAMTNGRWELARPLKALTMEERLERAFDRAALLCRETAGDLNWPEALRLLRLWEYTGRVRRGYFIEGLSGVQYIRDSEFAGIRNAMEQPDSRVQWLPAVDPAQPWGKALSHGEGRRFLNVPGTAVALRAGVPVAVLERQGTLRIFSGDSLPEVLKAFVLAFSGRRIYPALRRLTLREYPPDASQALAEAGFSREMQDFVLYRGIQ